MLVNRFFDAVLDSVTENKLKIHRLVVQGEKSVVGCKTSLIYTADSVNLDLDDFAWGNNLIFKLCWFSVQVVVLKYTSFVVDFHYLYSRLCVNPA